MTLQLENNDNTQYKVIQIQDDADETRVFIDASSSAGAGAHAFGTPGNGDVDLRMPNPTTNPGQRVFIAIPSHLSTWTSSNRPSNANIIYLSTPSGVIMMMSNAWALLNSTGYDVNTATFVSNGTNWILQATH